MGPALNWLPVVAAVFAVPQFLPQLAHLWRTRDTAGVSWSWAALTSVSNGGWIGYFALSRFWTALVPATSATVLAGALAVLLARRGGIPPARCAHSQLERLADSRVGGLRPRGAWHRAGRFVCAPGHAVGVDRLPHRAANRSLARDVAADPRRAVLLGHLRPTQVRPAIDRPRLHRGDREHAHARPSPKRRDRLRSSASTDVAQIANRQGADTCPPHPPSTQGSIRRTP